MSGTDDKEVAEQRAVNVVSTAVSVVAAVFLGGGFYYGMTKQKKALEEEEKSLGKPSASKKKFEPKNATLFERKLALDKPLAPGTAAWKALLGVTLVSITGCCLLVGGAAATLGVTNNVETKQIDFEGLGEVKKEILDVIADEVKQDEVEAARK
ncbi:Metal tolerance protein 5 [Phytophthora nicotianae]|uniref:Metal tolerance protein 5 n=1 Tax=Phytophthora nicotianae TaxID=4792 RepID=A0A0W8DKZ1_PHYNI|nr:Metal tolerance protein 5 [Phytophthora nicotianae]